MIEILSITHQGLGVYRVYRRVYRVYRVLRLMIEILSITP